MIGSRRVGVSRRVRLASLELGLEGDERPSREQGGRLVGC